ncbi:MAG: beta-ketoacyl-[acyl-carrier-protein] synthase family protein, partial [Bacteroidales bacterium]|nr:beta-ketoacyl-[acyl-carrier-protein] synthase family protein [Bacteroidales bacterium]
MAEKLVVTGMGVISGLGVGKEQTLAALLAEKSSVGKIRYLNTEHTDIPVSEVPMTDSEMKGLLGIPSDQLVTRTPLMAMIAVKEALEQANILTNKPERIAFINGTTVGGMEKSEQYYIDFLENENHKEYIAAHDCGAGTDDVADFFSVFDTTATISTACSSAINALIYGANLIKTGKVDAAVVGGTECLSKFHLNGFNTLMILDREPCKPFSANRVGLNLGEGAAYLVLEKADDAQKRGVLPLCELSGYANSCDAFHQTASSPNGQGAFLAMQGALADAHLQPSDIDYINAHGTGT